MTCDTTIGFPTAPQMEQLATNNPIIWKEICAIQQAILAAASLCQPGGGKMCTTVGGTTPMTFLTGISGVTVIDGGSDYYQDVPGISFIPPNGVIPSSVAAGTVITNGGNILSINVTSPGAGYIPVLSTLSVSSVSGSLANLQPLVNAAGNIVGINIINGGVNYTIGDSVVATRALMANPGYTNATFAITSVSVTGEILAVAILNTGSGYQPSNTEVQIVSTLNPSMPYPLGGGFVGTVTVDSFGEITGVLVNNNGAGYANFLPYLVITDPGYGATTTVALSGTSVSSIDVNTSGSQYTMSATGYVLNPPTAALPNPPATPAVITLNVANNTYGTDPHVYWQVWSETATNTAIQLQLNVVLSYFTALGYTILIQTNPQSGSTIQWHVCW